MSRSGSAYWDSAPIPAWPTTSLAKKDGEARDSPKRWISFGSTNVNGIVFFPQNGQKKTATQTSESGSFSGLTRTLSKMCFPHLPSSAVLGLGALMISPVYPEHLVALVIV